MTILEQVQEDVKTAMKAGEKERVGQLRMLVNSLQAEEKEGKGDEVAALQRERKRRLDAAEALKEGFVPCTRCMKKYLGLNASLEDLVDDRAEIAEAVELP